MSPKIFRISLETGEQFNCAKNEKVLTAMERAAVCCVQVGCRGGGCGACRIEVIEGEYDTLIMSKHHVSNEEASQGYALACRVLPKSDLVIKAAPKRATLEKNEPQ